MFRLRKRNYFDRRVAEIQISEKTYLIVIKDETGLKGGVPNLPTHGFP